MKYTNVADKDNRLISVPETHFKGKVNLAQIKFTSLCNKRTNYFIDEANTIQENDPTFSLFYTLN